ncbi:kunitz type trypsin inhibitor 104-like [Cicer arietinum]|uniref:Miraculin-like n=1 Tax=Cicer arietinum TaxID=3827 RepID=A0A1S2Z3N7_CICAR|nr:miraculin-like [Cicer arietinum]
MSTKSLTIFTFAHIWLLMTTTSIAQFTIDTSGEPVEIDEEYFIVPATTGNGGRSTLVTRDGSCPFNVGVENTNLHHGLDVKFTPFAPHNDDDFVRLDRDLRISFDEDSSNCSRSTEWRLGERDAKSGRRLIITGRDDSTIGSFGNFFRIVQTQTVGIYNIQWCPKEVCPTCDFICGTVGILRENGKIQLALDGDALSFVFQNE